MAKAYTSQWIQLWRRWSDFERAWRDDQRSALLTALMTFGDDNRETFLKEYQQAARLPQPTNDEVDELRDAGSRLRSLSREDPLPDVYAAACFMKEIWQHVNQKGDATSGFRGQRNDQWELTPSIHRNLPAPGPERTAELEKRLRVLALFCEALRQILADIDSVEIARIAIAQHYGIASPLIDLTWSPWVALFFASDGGQIGDVGIVQCFSLAELECLTGHGKSRLGVVRVVKDVEFVPRIKAQRGFFLELPCRFIDRALIPFQVRFVQQEGLVFESDLLGVSRDCIYPPESSDRFAPFAAPTLDCYPRMPEPRELSVDDYVCEAKAWYPQEVMDGSTDIERAVRELCDFHWRLQSVSPLRNYERSLTKLRMALGRIFVSHRGSDPCTMSDLVEFYASQASEEGREAIVAVWASMKVT